MVKEPFLAYFGHVNIDVMIKVKSIPTHGSIGVERMSEVFGGTAGNFAIISSKLGINFDLYSSVSSVTHRDYLEKLEKMGIDISHITIQGTGMGPVCYIVSDGSDQIAYVFQGPMDSWKPSLGFKNNRYRYAHFSTGPAEEYLRIAQQISEDSVIVFDPSQEISYKWDRETLISMLDLADFFIGNLSEFETLQKMTGLGIREITANGTDVIATLGERGSSLYTKNSRVDVPPLKLGPPRDSTGAGDSYRAGLYFGLSMGKSMRESMAIASVVAAEAIREGIDAMKPNIEKILNESTRLIF
ncbi:MAG: carbohydrate kinase family protein [Thermoplasmataceae archaeon]